MCDDHDFNIPDEVVMQLTLASARREGCTCDPPIIVLTERVTLGEVPGLGHVACMAPLVYHDQFCPVLIRLVAPTN